MNYVFRQFPRTEPPPPAPGEIQLRPLPAYQAAERRLALLVLEHGLAALPQGEGPIERIVVQDDPTFDDMLASTFVEFLLLGQELPAGARLFAQFAALVREGIRPTAMPLEASLEGIYLTLRNLAGADLTEPGAAESFVNAWYRMASRIQRAARAGLDPYTVPLFATDPEFARERAFLTADQQVYRQDRTRAERWWVRLPGGPDRAAGLVLKQPRSILWKSWARADPEAPGGAGYLFLAACETEHHWRFSTDPVYRLSLRSLADELQRAESARDPVGAAKDPWFDGQPFGYTLVAAPLKGTAFSDSEVLGLVRRYTAASPVDRRPRWKGAVAAAVAVLLLAVGLADRHHRFWLGGLLPKPVSEPLDERGLYRVSAAVNGTPLERGLPVREQLHEGRFTVQLPTVLQPGSNEVMFTAHRRVSEPVKLSVVLEAPGRLTVEGRQLRVNDGPLRPLTLSGSDAEPASAEIEAFFRPGDNRVAVTLANTGSRDQPVTVRLRWRINHEFRRDLYLLTVGVSRYKFNDRLNLDFARPDAEALCHAFQQQQSEGRLFRRVIIEDELKNGPLTDERAEKDSLLSRLRWLRYHATPESLVIVAIAAHGDLGLNERFFLLPFDYDPSKDNYASSAISWEDIQEFLLGIPCPVVVLMDTCHSGAIRVGSRGADSPAEVLNAAVAEAMWRFASSKNGLVIMAACGAQQKAAEAEAWGHGAFTLAVLEALQGRYLYQGQKATPLPGRNGRRVLTLADLDAYARARVAELRGSTQAVETKPTEGIVLDYIPIAVLPH